MSSHFIQIDHQASKMHSLDEEGEKTKLAWPKELKRWLRKLANFVI